MEDQNGRRHVASTLLAQSRHDEQRAAVVTKIPRNFPGLHIERGSPSLAGASTTEPEEESFLCPGPVDSEASFKENEPFDAVSLCVHCLEEAGHVRLSVRERLGATPLSATLSDPAGDVFGSTNRLKPFAKGRHEQSPDREDCWSLAGPNVASTLMLSKARTIRGRLFFPLTELGAHSAAARGAFPQQPEACFDTQRRQ